MTMTEYHREMHTYYNIEIDLQNYTYYIPDEECYRTSELVESYNEVAQEVFLEYCIREYNWRAEEYAKYEFIIVIFIITVVIALLILIIIIVGFYKVLDSLFYVFSGHWILVWIIKMREGENMGEQLDSNLKDLIENDEEIASAIIDTENDIDEEEPQGNASKSDNWKGDKVKERKKLLKRLEKQYSNCLQGDKDSNDEFRVKFEESSKRMSLAISILQMKEQENFITNFVRDLKRAFSFNLNKVEAVATTLDDGEDINFANSRIQKADFFMFRIKDYLTKECKKDNLSIKELVRISVEKEPSDDENADKENKELIEKQLPEKAKKPKGYKGGQVQPFQKDK